MQVSSCSIKPYRVAVAISDSRLDPGGRTANMGILGAMGGRGNDRGVLLGLVLVALGIVVLLARLVPIDLASVGWPFFVIIPGAVLLVLALLGRGGTSLGLTLLGSIVTMTGLLLLYQNATGHYESWAYAWALVAPTGLGIGLILHGWRAGRQDLMRSGSLTAGSGIVLFLLGGIFFEVVIGISGREFDPLFRVLFPLLLIGLGLLLLAANALPGRWRQMPQVPRGSGGRTPEETSSHP